VTFFQVKTENCECRQAGWQKEKVGFREGWISVDWLLWEVTSVSVTSTVP